MDLLQGLDENDLSDIDLDYSMEADDSGIDACEARRSIRNYDPDFEDEEEEEVTSSGESYEERREDRYLLERDAWRNQLRMKINPDENDRFGINRIAKLYEPITAAQLERMNRGIGTDDDESILEVELTASGEDDEDSSVLELVIPMQNKFPKRSRFRAFQMFCNFFCCRPLK